MGGDFNRVVIVRADGVERWERMVKPAVAQRLAQAAADAIAGD
jgi:hypothetical protein